MPKGQVLEWPNANHFRLLDKSLLLLLSFCYQVMNNGSPKWEICVPDSYKISFGYISLTIAWQGANHMPFYHFLLLYICLITDTISSCLPSITRIFRVHKQQAEAKIRLFTAKLLCCYCTPYSIESSNLHSSELFSYKSFRFTFLSFVSAIQVNLCRCRCI